jgi:hypothetical protein
MNFYALIGTLSLAILALLIYGICDFARYLRQERESQELRDLEQRNQERLDLIEFWFSAGKREGLKQEAARHQQELFDLLVEGANMIVDAQSGGKKPGRPRNKKT